MKIKKEKKFKRCPRCGAKTFSAAKVCGKCELNFDKFNLASNEEGKKALRQGEKERVVWTKQLPSDLNKWELFFMSLVLGWSGAHLWKSGKFTRGICHTIGLVLGAIYVIIFNFNVNNLIWNMGNIFGVFWIVTFCMSVFDIFEIAFNVYKVPVSLPYKEDKWKQ